MPYKVIVDHAPSYELLLSAYLYLNRSSMRGSNLGPGWYKEVNQSVSSKLAAELKDQRLEVLHRLAILAWQCPDKTSADAFLDWLESLSTGEIIERMLPWVSVFKDDMRVVKERIISLLRLWNEEYFRHLSQDIMHRLEESARLEAVAVGREPAVEHIERVTNGLYLMPTDVDHTVIMIPQYHCAPYDILDFYDEGLVVLQYAARDTRVGQSAEEALARTARCLSDEHRLRILSLLADGPKTFTEIMSHVGLGRGLVHYHIVQLRIAGFIRSHHLNGRTLHYTLRPEQMTQFANGLFQLVQVRA